MIVVSDEIDHLTTIIKILSKLLAAFDQPVFNMKASFVSLLSTNW